MLCSQTARLSEGVSERREPFLGFLLLAVPFACLVPFVWKPQGLQAVTQH